MGWKRFDNVHVDAEKQLKVMGLVERKMEILVRNTKVLRFKEKKRLCIIISKELFRFLFYFHNLSISSLLILSRAF